MASPFNVELTMRESPSDAQARAATALSDPARAVGLRLNRDEAGELGYRPPVKFPLIMALWHRLNGEQITVRFEAAEGGATRVRISGAVADGKYATASEPAHWSEALGAGVESG